jgi:hypothetical protein
LIELLPRCSNSKVPLSEITRGPPWMTNSIGAKILIFAVLGAAALLLGTMREPSSHTDPADAVLQHTSPPQTSLPISR